MKAPGIRYDMSPEEFEDARHRLGLNQRDFAELFGIASDRTVRRWEEGDKDIPGPVIVLVRLCLEYPEVRDFLGLQPWPITLDSNGAGDE